MRKPDLRIAVEFQIRLTTMLLNAKSSIIDFEDDEVVRSIVRRLVAPMCCCSLKTEQSNPGSSVLNEQQQHRWHIAAASAAFSRGGWLIVLHEGVDKVALLALAAILSASALQAR